MKKVFEVAGLLVGILFLFAAVLFSAGFMFGLGWLMAFKALGAI